MFALLVVEKTRLWHALTIEICLGLNLLRLIIFNWGLETERCLVAKGGKCVRLSSLLHTLALKLHLYEKTKLA